MHEAMFYHKVKDNIVQCDLCPHNCFIQPGKRGICAVRKNEDGKLYTLVYGKAIARHVDPVEKKPLFHYKPGTKIYSFATAGCNFKCEFCQNWSISQISKGKKGQIIGEEASPEDIVQDAINYGCESIAMTYVEPTIFYEYALDVAKLAKEKGLGTVFVSNGFINKEPVDELSKYLDATNIDLKSFSDGYYKNLCGGRLQPVLDAIKHYHKKEVWVEVTTLIIPEKNDSDDELKKIAGFIASIDKNIPWHISRFHPDYKMVDSMPTPRETLERAYEIGKQAGLRHVYVGNLVGNKYESTFCPGCNKKLIGRYGYMITENNIRQGKCMFCDEEIEGRW